ncbi:mevalonate kinase [Byssothecium circinans]|uniref:Mevalonate kinase n=1 Tax=Byssothecium circinans TaxID=147558 RepID=A0A6A5UA75_9PLEO|nr:mevalonate kinase [Byssothecium circinans]
MQSTSTNKEMSSKFMVSAPGKVILCGEHASVYNKPAIAAAIAPRSYLLVAPSEDPRAIVLDFRDIGLNHAWDMDALPWDHDALLPANRSSYVNTLDTSLLQAILPHASTVSNNLPEAQRKIHIRSAAAFLYLFMSLGLRDGPGSVYTLRSFVPVGAGLGSSASVCVCWSAALLLQNGTVARPDAGLDTMCAKGHVEAISNWAFLGERCIHGDPSGVDNAVSAGGDAVLFQRNTPEPPRITPILSLPKLPMLLIDTKQERSTEDQIKKVRANLCEGTERYLDDIEELTNSVLELISSGGFVGPDKIHAVRSLGDLMSQNHRLLALLGASHPRLERIIKLVDGAGIGWTKLTGAGGGGCTITLLNPDVTDETKQRLERQLNAEGYKLYKTSLGSKGVGFRDCSMVEGDPIGDMTEEFTADLEFKGIARGLKDWMFWRT